MKISCTETEYAGWAHCRCLSNGVVDLIATTEVGPRIIRFGFSGDRNLFKEFDEQLGLQGEPDFQSRGGHRLWVAPEITSVTFAPDNTPIGISEEHGTLCLRAPGDRAGIRKTMKLSLHSRKPVLKLEHSIENLSHNTLKAAVWALTVLVPGGTAVAGLPPLGSHPENLLPEHAIILWPYTDLSDRRIFFTSRHIFLRQDASAALPVKIGLHTRTPWAAYFHEDILFCKIAADADEGATYPDLGSSIELFTNREMLEVESLGEMQELNQGQEAHHTEWWSLTRLPGPVPTTGHELQRFAEGPLRAAVDDLMETRASWGRDAP